MPDNESDKTPPEVFEQQLPPAAPADAQPIAGAGAELRELASEQAEPSIGPVVDAQWHDMLELMRDLMETAEEEPVPAMEALIDEFQHEKDDVRDAFDAATTNEELRVVQERLATLRKKITDAKERYLKGEL